MRGRLLVSAGLLLAAMAASGFAHVGATTEYPPTCYDLRTDQYLTATQWLDEPGTLTGTNGRDVLVGSYGDDVINGLGGNDVICGSNTLLKSEYVEYLEGGFDTINGGGGNDSISGAGAIDGGSGSDVIDSSVSYSGGGEDDDDEEIVVTVYGGTGNDTITAFAPGDGPPIGHVDVDCGPGNDSYAVFGDVSVVNCEIELDVFN